MTPDAEALAALLALVRQFRAAKTTEERDLALSLLVESYARAAGLDPLEVFRELRRPVLTVVEGGVR